VTRSISIPAGTVEPAGSPHDDFTLKGGGGTKSKVVKIPTNTGSICHKLKALPAKSVNAHVDAVDAAAPMRLFGKPISPRTSHLDGTCATAD
jgi:hypothetical protein